MDINYRNIEEQLEKLYQEHEFLDYKIDNYLSDSNISLLDLQRLKKRKLSIKDQIQLLESRIYPDIIA